MTWQKNTAQELAAGGGLGGYTVYNLTVADDHTFFVGITGGGAWMHNSCAVTSPTWTSPGGLEYGPDASYGNRVMHVFRHLAPGGASHSVFNVGTSGELLDLLDEAWGKRGLPLPSDTASYLVQMGRTIGTRGEQTIKVVVVPGTNKVITAYPVR